MPLDPSIILGTQAPQIENPLDVATKALTLKNLTQRTQIQNQQIADDQAVRSAFQNNTKMAPDGTPQVDRAGMLSELTSKAPMKAIEMNQNFIAQDNAKLDAQIKATKDRNDLAHELAYSIPTGPDVPQATKEIAWAAAKQKAVALGLPGAQQSPDFFPGDDFVKSMQAHTGSAKEQSDLAIKQRELAQTDTKNAIEQESVNVKKQDLELQRRKLYGGSDQGSAKPGAPVDPATLVPKMVAEGRQKDALEEIKERQNLKALGPNILAAYDKGISRNPVVAAQGKAEFEALINTTVKEQEGTARQAAFDSIHKNMSPIGLTALPGQDASRRNTVINYLKSKGSAPTNKAFGIDLDQYPSTRLSFGTINMKDPKGNIRAIPEDMVEAAKKKGGQVL